MSRKWPVPDEIHNLIERLEAENKRLREQRVLIAQFIYKHPPFDECAGIDLHERAAEYSSLVYAEYSMPGDYYQAFLDCCAAALEVNVECDHDWVDATNEVISSGVWCRKCNAIGEASDA